MSTLYLWFDPCVELPANGEQCYVRLEGMSHRPLVGTWDAISRCWTVTQPAAADLYWWQVARWRPIPTPP